MKKLLLTCMLALGFGASAQIALPYTETFATIPAANGFPVVSGGAWTRSGTITSQATYIANQSTYNRSGNGDTFFITYYYSGNTSGNYYFVGPFNLTAGTNYTSSILYKADGLNGFGPLDLRFGTAATAATQTNLIATVPANITNAAFQKLSGSFTVPTTGSYYLSVKETNTSSPWYLTLDDFKVNVTPTCLEPTALSTANVTTTTADLSWTASVTTPANGYEVYYSTSTTPPTASSTPNMTGVTGTTANLTGLMSSSVYYAYVRSACSASDKSEWSAVSKFTTLCTPFSIPYTENFDTTATGSSTATNAPTCWTYLETASSAGYGYVTTSTPASAPNNYYLYNSSDNAGNIMLVSPQTTALSSGLNRVRFNARGSAGYVLQLGTVSNNTDANTFNLFSSVTLTAANANYTVDIPVGTESFLAFKHGLGGTFRSIYLDDITVEAIPSCLAPVTPSITGATSTSLSVAWTAPATAPALGYDIYYSSTNTAPTGATVLNGTNSVTSTAITATIPGLTANTVYYVWVRSNCSASDQSTWASAGSANTGYCAASSTTQASWISVFNSTGAATNMNYSSAAAASATGYANLSATNKISNFAGSVTPISLTSGGPTTGFAIWVDWNNNLVFEASEKVFGTTGYVTTTTGTITVPASAAIGNYRMRTAVDWNTSTITDPCAVISRGEYVDYAFEVVAAPSCVAPTALAASNITLTTADLTWSGPATAPANGYDIYYSTTSTAPTAATVPTTTSATATASLSGLTQATQYFVWVRSNCSAADKSSWTALPSFTTVTPPPANDDCANPTALTPGGTFAQNAVTGNNVAATNDGTPSGTCTALVNGNVWYSVVVPASGSVTIETAAGTTNSVTDTVISVYTGACGTTTTLCNDDSTGAFSKLVLTGQAAGSTLLISVWTYNTTVRGNFQISAYDGSLATGETIVKNDKGFSIAPNPFTDVVRISDVKDVVSISVVDLSGRLVKTLKPASEINLGELRSGMYLINLTMKDGSVKTVKAIKK